MSGLSLTLSNALTGLNVNQKALAVLSQNIANANTAGYSRQVLTQDSLYLDGNGMGVTIKDITRQVDEYLVGAARDQTSSVGYSSTVTNFLDRVQLLMGSPGSNNNMSAFISSFFNNIQSLAQAPEDSTKQQMAVQAGVTLATQVSDMARQLQDLQFEADNGIANAVNTVNEDLRQIQQLNVAISNAQSLGKPTGDLQDKRDLLLNDVARYLDIKVFKRENGAVNITTTSGVSLLDDNAYQLNYNPASTAAAFTGLGTRSALTVSRTSGEGTAITLISGGSASQVASSITGGIIRGLVDVRDQQIPAITDQLDMMAATLRDTMNAIHNAGTAYPGAPSLTGTRLIGAADTGVWEGSVRIAVLDASGAPILSSYPGQVGGVPPLEIDLSQLDTGSGKGSPSLQGIIDEINHYYGAQQDKLQLGNLDNIRLTSNNKSLPGLPPQFNFDFDLSNRSADGSNFYVTGVTITDDNNVNIGAPSATIPSVALASTTTFSTNSNSTTVTVNTAGTHSLTAGMTVYIPAPTSPATIGGVPSSQFGGFFTIKNVTGTSFQIDIASEASSFEAPSIAGMTALPPYASVAAGDDVRSKTNGSFTANLTSSSTSQFYTISVNMAVDDGKGNITQTTATYRVNSQATNLMNDRYVAGTATGDGIILAPTSRAAIATAMLVDANGNELPKINGAYTTIQQGYLVIKANGASNSIAIDSMNSSQKGTNGANGTNRSFSHYLELNNFFASTAPNETGDVTTGAAVNLKVESRLSGNPGLMSLGSLVRSSDTPGLAPRYTYERQKGDNSIIQQMAGLGTAASTFLSAGGLPITNVTFSAYAANIIATASQKNATSQTALENAQTLLTGFTERATSISGVNLDTELANTIIYQNAYSASARIITVTNDLFDTLMQLAR